MPGPEPHRLSIAEAGARMRDGRLTSTELTRAALARIAAVDPLIDAFVTVCAERALADAAIADADFAAGVDRGPLQGMPYALKDIYDTAGIRTTCHSRLLADNVPAQDAAVVAKLEAGGAVLLGKTATHEFATGGPSFDLPFPPARNPWNTAHVPGGSSSGSAAAVAAGICRMAMGSDTGGSIRGPAGYCGTVGLKPTYGLVSRRGVFPLSYTLDHCGPLTASVEDCALTMAVIAGHDPGDPASAETAAPDFRAGLDRGVDGLRIALPRSFYRSMAGAEQEALDAIEQAAQRLAGAGATIEEIDLPEYDLFNACGRVILAAEAFTIHEQDFRSRPLDYGRFTYLRTIPGALVSAADLVQAQRLRRELAVHLNHVVLERFDAVVTGSTLAPAPRLENPSPDTPPVWPVQTMPFNVTGNPAMSMPIGLSASGLPLSVQIVGRLFDEPMVLRIGAELERMSSFDMAPPELAPPA